MVALLMSIKAIQPVAINLRKDWKDIRIYIYIERKDNMLINHGIMICARFADAAVSSGSPIIATTVSFLGCAPLLPSIYDSPARFHHLNIIKWLSCGRCSA
jgi:hypothetical protein